MAIYHLVRAGVIVDTQDFADDPPTLAANKGVWLPQVEDSPAFDPISQVQQAETLTIEADRVVHATPVRDKTSDEVAAMKASKVAGISAEFVARAYAPIDLTVSGQAYQFDTDKDAIENLTGVMAMISAGVLTAARNWKPYGSDSLISMAPSDFVALVGSIAARKDTLYGVKWALEAALEALTAPADVNAFDPAQGWS